LLASFSDQEDNENVVDGINMMTRLTGYALTPVT
jgi:hypothetical protein